MKVLLVTDSYPPNRISGVGQVVKSLHKEYKKKNINSTVLTTGIMRDKNGDIISFSENIYFGNLINNFVLLKYCLSNKYDIIHLHQSLCTIFLPIVKFLTFIRISRIIVVNTLHVDYISEFKNVKPEKTKDKTIHPSNKELVKKYLFYPVHILIDVIGYYCADIITALSTQNKMEIEFNYGFIYKRNSQIIPNGFDDTNFKYSKREFNSNTINFIYTGSFRARKRITKIIELLAQTQNKSQKNIRLLLIGDGSDEYKSQLKEFITHKEFEKNVTFIGVKENSELQNYYKSGHFFIITSSYEGFPVSILEAMGSGLIVISNSHYGVKDMLDNQSAFVIEDNLINTVDNLSTLLENEKEMQTISSNSYQLVKEKYTIEKIAMRYIQLYKDEIENKS